MKNQERAINDLSTLDLKNLSVEVKKLTDDYILSTRDSFRYHLGASVIGASCKRKLWYEFRWCALEDVSARIQRLFKRGHREEEVIVDEYRKSGATIWQTDDKGKQYRFSALGGHFGGSIDGVIRLPFLDKPLLFECKTKKKGYGFNNIVKNGVQNEEPKHFSQMSIYGKAFSLAYALYVVVCKDDDHRHVEVVKLDMNVGEQLIQKARLIIESQTPPPRISNSPIYSDCKFCALIEVCHMGSPADNNCRSCRFAKPLVCEYEEAPWVCGRNGQVIPKDFINQSVTNCPNCWEDITRQ